MWNWLRNFSQFKQFIIRINMVYIIFTKNPLASCQFTFNGYHGSHALRTIQIRNCTKQMGKLGEESRHASSFIVNQQKSNFIRMKINCQRQYIRLNNLGFTRTSSSCNKSMWTMCFFM